MITSEFNALSLPEKTALVFANGKLLTIFLDKTKQHKSFYYTLYNLNVDVIFDRLHNQLKDVVAWDNISERKVV